MNLRKVLSPQTTKVGLQGETKNEIIEELLDLICTTGKVSDREIALQALLERERKMSTGMEHGVAIPHGKTETVDGLLVALGTHPTGIDFEALDGAACRIFVMTLSPKDRSGPHIQFLAEVSRILRSEAVREMMLAATSPEELLRIVTA
jgi:mannitol/fructose-specific phosphotransferase system IIA component (Ntr-type)